jgi:hypothetical protein
MRNYTTLESNLQKGILRFSEKICSGLTRLDFKFVSQMIYGLLTAQNCHLSKLSAFNGGAALFENHIGKIRGFVSDKTILIVDNSDITKLCSPKMEYIAKVRDGSTGEIGKGYYALSVMR